MAACQYDNVEMVKLFLTPTTVWEVKTPSRNPAAKQLAQSKRMLWFAGIKLNPVNMRKHTAFVIASENGHLSILQLLLDSSRDNKDRDLLNQNEGTTALRSACMRSHVDCVEWLLEQGADAGIANEETGSTPLLVSCVFRLQEVVECLFRHRTAEELRFYEARTATENSTPYMLAAGGRNPALLKLLLEFDADNKVKKEALLNAKNERGWTALDHAVIRQSCGIKEADEMLAILLAAGAKAPPVTFSRSFFMGGGFGSLRQLWSNRVWKPSDDIKPVTKPVAPPN